MKIGARGVTGFSPPYILITAAGAWILITLISGRCAQLSGRCVVLTLDGAADAAGAWFIQTGFSSFSLLSHDNFLRLGGLEKHLWILSNIILSL